MSVAVFHRTTPLQRRKFIALLTDVGVTCATRNRTFVVGIIIGLHAFAEGHTLEVSRVNALSDRFFVCLLSRQKCGLGPGP